MTKTYISLGDLHGALGSDLHLINTVSYLRISEKAKTLDELQVSEIEAMTGYMGHSLREDNDGDEDEYLSWFVENELKDEGTFNTNSAYNAKFKELADITRIDEVGDYFVAINKNA